MPNSIALSLVHPFKSKNLNSFSSLISFDDRVIIQCKKESCNPFSFSKAVASFHFFYHFFLLTTSIIFYKIV